MERAGRGVSERPGARIESGDFPSRSRYPFTSSDHGVSTMTTTRPWRVTLQGAAALAAAMGVGRFVYTPILPLMHAQAGLTVQLGSTLATANYVGYLVGALVGIAVPRAVRSAAVLRTSLVVIVVTLALMPTTHDAAAWITLRTVAGIASALVFVIAVNAVLTALRGHGQHLTGWAFGGVGAGIALSGVLVLALRGADTWRQAWWLAGALSLVLTAPAWMLPLQLPAAEAPTSSPAPTHIPATSHRHFLALFASYTLEGIGYIIAGTFLVAAIDQSAPRWAGTGAWVLAGLAALPSSALWAWLSRVWPRPTLLVAALVIQAVGIALPALVGGIGPALVSAAAFGATFVGISTITLATGAHLGTPRAVAILTTGYSVGQIAGPLLVTPLLHNGYHEALLIAAAILLVAAAASGFLRHRFPHHLGPLPSRLHDRDPAVTTTRAGADTRSAAGQTTSSTPNPHPVGGRG
jgi:MFS family permease